MFLLQDKYFDQRPPHGSYIDWSDPITRGMKLCYLFNEGAGSIITDLVTMQNAIPVGHPAWSTVPKFSSTRSGASPFVDASSGWRVPLRADLNNLPALSIVTEYWMPVIANPQVLFSKGSLYCVSSGGTPTDFYWAREYDADAFERHLTYTPSTGGWQHTIFTMDATNQVAGMHVYKNNQEVGYNTQGDGGTLADDDSGSNFKIMCDAGAAGGGQGYMNYFLLFNRVITGQERARLFYDRFCFVRSGRNVPVAITVPSGVSSTFNVPAQSLTLVLPVHAPGVILGPNALPLTLSQPGLVQEVKTAAPAQPLTLSAPAPSVSTASVTTVQVPAQTISVSLVAPVKSVSALPPAQGITASVVAPAPGVTILPAAQSLALALVNPSAQVIALIPALSAVASLQGITKAISVLPAPLTLTFTLVPPSVSASPVTTVQIPAQTVSVVLVAPIAEVRAFPPAQTVQTTLVAPTVSTASVTTVQVPALSMNLSLPGITTACAKSPQALTMNAILGGTVPSVSVIKGGLNLTLLMNTPIVALIQNSTFVVPPFALSLALGGATIGGQTIREVLMHTKNKQPRNVTKTNAQKAHTHKGL